MSVSPPWLLKEDELPEEIQAFLSSLPREKGWAEPHLYQYQGIWCASWQFPFLLDCQMHFQANDADILVASHPKCGTTWLMALSFAILNRFRYPPADIHHPLLTKNPHGIVPCLDLDFDPNNRIPDCISSASKCARLIATHLPHFLLPKSTQESKCKIIYICRNPKDTFISLWHFTNKLRRPELGTSTIEEAFDLFCRGVTLFGPFWEHVLSYWKESLERPDQVLFLKYEEMKRDPGSWVRRIAEFMGCPFSPEEEASGVVGAIVSLCCFENLSNLEVNKTGGIVGYGNNSFFRKAEVGDWRNYLSPEMAERLDLLTAEKFHGFGLDL